ncbi:hypothetical protein OQI_30580 [Streptomyces pharetrae CZA14]|uniref:Uncharacterized protein n=1 Tax=Streptomyces pharetrae CZA14 TaxID=1144883 RepID=A0ABX3YAP9_9ACTN|nr:hypothetical protein OQI_30580 [Streptomyces pharetrae CZA14]
MPIRQFPGVWGGLPIRRSRASRALDWFLTAVPERLDGTRLGELRALARHLADDRTEIPLTQSTVARGPRWGELALLLCEVPSL